MSGGVRLFHPLGIRTRLVVSSVLLVLLPAVAIGVIAVRTLWETERERALAQLRSVAVLKEAEIESWVASRVTDLRLLARDPDLQEDLSTLLRNQGWALEHDSARQSISRAAQHFLEVTRSFDALFLMNERGEVVWSTVPQALGEYRGLQPYFRRGLYEPRVDVQTLAFSSTSEGVNAVVAVQPVADRAGHRGVLAGQTSLARLNEIMQERSGLGETGETYLVSGGDVGVLLTQTRFGTETPGTSVVASPGVRQSMRWQSDIEGEFEDYRDTSVLGVYHWVPELQVVLAAERDKAETFAPMYAALRAAVLMAGVAVLVAAGAGLVFTERLSRALGAVSGAARRLAAGDLSVSAPVARRDEIGQLAQSFNHMTARLREMMENLSTTLNSIGDAVIATDCEGRVVRMNPVAEQLTGWRLHEAYGRPLQQIYRLLSEEGGQPCVSPVQRVLRDGLTVAMGNHTLLVDRDGVERPIADSGAPIRDREGMVQGVVLVFRDVTGARQVERERMELLARAEAARQEAEAANRAKDEFLAVLSHELRTPLTAILGWAQMLSRGLVEQSDIPHAVQIIERNAWEQSQIVNEILDVSSIIRGKLQLDVQPVDLVEVVDASMDSVRLAADAKQIRITREVDGRGAMVNGDRNRLQQVFWNLLTNAIKFTPEQGRVQVRIARSGAHVQVTVSDSGVGIRPEFLPHLFERFRQADSSRTRKFGGLGLGLAIVRHLVELHGGTVRGESEGEGHGASFTIELPLCIREQSGAPAAEPPQPVPQTARVGDRRLEGMRLLLVDDQPDTLKLLQALLARSGAQTKTAYSADEALQTLKQWRPDVLVSDVAMPQRDGLDLIRDVRALPAEMGGATPALALTALAFGEDCQRILSAGFDGYLSKPVDGQKLTTALLQVSENAPRTVAAGGPAQGQ